MLHSVMGTSTDHFGASFIHRHEFHAPRYLPCVSTFMEHGEDRSTRRVRCHSYGDYVPYFFQSFYDNLPSRTSSDDDVSPISTDLIPSIDLMNVSLTGNLLPIGSHDLEPDFGEFEVYINTKRIEDTFGPPPLASAVQIEYQHIALCNAGNDPDCVVGPDMLHPEGGPPSDEGKDDGTGNRYTTPDLVGTYCAFVRELTFSLHASFQEFVCGIIRRAPSVMASTDKDFCYKYNPFIRSRGTLEAILASLRFGSSVTSKAISQQDTDATYIGHHLNSHDRFDGEDLAEFGTYCTHACKEYIDKFGRDGPKVPEGIRATERVLEHAKEDRTTAPSITANQW